MHVRDAFPVYINASLIEQKKKQTKILLPLKFLFFSNIDQKLTSAHCHKKKSFYKCMKNKIFLFCFTEK